jgi:hypothetical protein
VISFAPKVPRLVVLAVWLFVATVPVWAVEAIGRQTDASKIVAFGIVGPLLVVIGCVRCMAMRLTLDETAVCFRNVLVERRYEWNDIAEISLSRFGTGRMVADESLWMMWTPTGCGIYWPSVAIRSKDRKVSPPVLVTMFVGPASRRRVLQYLGDYSLEHSVPVTICDSNRGWMFGISWDIKVGTGILSDA